ncbi:hypothetical protein FB451DRAFT_1179690 [Mycena latifolia]|nr:hypothetical protein FB451DRAFT_1179690 [Mycena latifolia]
MPGLYRICYRASVLIARNTFEIFGYDYHFGDIVELATIHLEWLDVPVTGGLVNNFADLQTTKMFAAVGYYGGVVMIHRPLASTPVRFRNAGTNAAGANEAPVVTINREVWSGEASHDDVEMKNQGCHWQPLVPVFETSMYTFPSYDILCGKVENPTLGLVFDILNYLKVESDSYLREREKEKHDITAVVAFRKYGESVQHFELAARPDLLCAAHSHSTYGKAFSSFGKTLDPSSQTRYNMIVLDEMEGAPISDTLVIRTAAIL